ncbi:MAG: hypothetical protein IKU46_00900 [Peptococcaceae bacterium]|nr:hypothetical protein [Peptococcaceae bacterium]
MTTGWMKLHRTLLEKPVFEDAYTLQVLIYCMLKATYKEMTVKVGNQVIDLQPGQLLYGRKQVSQRLGMGEGKLRGIMEYLVRNGTVAIESRSRYSIVTIVNWEQYQKGEGEPEFPFDCDFLDGEDDWQNEDACPSCHSEQNEAEPKAPVLCCSALENTTNSQPHRNRSATQSETGFADLEAEISASREPQYNNINNNKQENKTKESHCRPIAMYADDTIVAQGLRGLISQYDYPSGGGVAKGESMPCGLAEQAGADTSSEGLAALSMLDDAALEAYFSSCAYAAYDGIPADEMTCTDIADEGFIPQIPLDDADLPSVQEPYCRPGHDFAAEMTYSLTEQDIARLEQMFSSSYAGRSVPAWPCEQLAFDALAVSDHASCASVDDIDPAEQDYIAAQQMFARIWDMYPVQTGREKISDAQIMRLYEVGEKRMKSAIRQYKIKKKRVPKKYWQNGSTFFNGGYEKYLL